MDATKTAEYLAEIVYNQPWLIDPDWLGKLDAVVRQAPNMTEAELRSAVFGNREEREKGFYMAADGVGVIPVMGMLFQRRSWFTRWFEVSTYEDLTETMGAVLQDDSVNTVVLHIDSPGGEAAGVFELSDFIRANRSVKPIITVADGMMGSAAYAIGSAAGQVHASESSHIGSIGVALRHVERSKMLSDIGLTVTYITSGTDKALGNPDEPLSEDARAKLQVKVDALAMLFFTLVARNRKKMSVEFTQSLEAGIFIANEAQEKGLIDLIRPIRQVIAGAAQSVSAAEPKTDRQPSPPVMQEEPGGEEADMDPEKLKALATLYGLPDTATEDEVLAAAEKSTADASEAQRKSLVLETRLAQQEVETQRQREEAADRFVTSLVSQGKFRDSDENLKATWKAQYLIDPELAQAAADEITPIIPATFTPPAPHIPVPDAHALDPQAVTGLDSIPDPDIRREDITVMQAFGLEQDEYNMAFKKSKMSNLAVHYRAEHGVSPMWAKELDLEPVLNQKQYYLAGS